VNSGVSYDASWPRAGDYPAHQDHADVVLIGVPTHKTSLSPSRADTTPGAVRESLRKYSHTFYTGESGVRSLDALAITDAGDVENPDDDREGAIGRLRGLVSQSSLVIALGGDNSATVPVATASLDSDWSSAGLITLDAHFDVRTGKSNGSPVRELIELGLPGPHIAQLGIADFANSLAYSEFVNLHDITVIARRDITASNLQVITERAFVAAGAGGGNIHVDIDVDVCDRAFVPACPASLPGGISAYELRTLVRLLAADPRVVSFDITEIDASQDSPDERTTRLAALLILEILAGFNERP
jgi:formiminoglutamase